MLSYRETFAELPFNYSELHFIGYIKDNGSRYVELIREMSESYGFQVCIFVIRSLDILIPVRCSYYQWNLFFLIYTNRVSLGWTLRTHKFGSRRMSWTVTSPKKYMFFSSIYRISPERPFSQFNAEPTWLTYKFKNGCDELRKLNEAERDLE